MAKGNKAKAVGPHVQVIMRAIGELVPHPENPKTHPKAQLQKIIASMGRFGWTIPVLIDENNQILAGHGRVLAGKQLGYPEAPCIIAGGFSEEQKLAYVVADNQLAAVSDWDKAKVSGELRALREAGYDLSLTGFDANKIQKMLADNPAPNIGETKSPSMTQTIALEWGDRMVPMDEDEVEMLDNALEEYVHERRSRAWFVDYVLNGAS